MSNRNMKDKLIDKVSSLRGSQIHKVRIIKEWIQTGTFSELEDQWQTDAWETSVAQVIQEESHGSSAALLVCALQELMNDLLGCMLSQESSQYLWEKEARLLVSLAHIIGFSSPPQLEIITAKLLANAPFIKTNDEEKDTIIYWISQCSAAYPINNDTFSHWASLLKRQSTAMIAGTKLVEYVNGQDDDIGRATVRHLLQLLREESLGSHWSVDLSILRRWEDELSIKKRRTHETNGSQFKLAGQQPYPRTVMEESITKKVNSSDSAANDWPAQISVKRTSFFDEVVSPTAHYIYPYTNTDVAPTFTPSSIATSFDRYISKGGTAK